MAVFESAITQQMQQVDPLVTPENGTVLLMGTMDSVIWLSIAILLTALIFFLSYALRFIYRRRFEERLQHHLGIFAPRIRVVAPSIRSRRLPRNTVYIVSVPPNSLLPSYDEANKNSTIQENK